MIKDAMEKNEKATPNGADLEVLKEHFGMCFNSDGSLDFVKLKARLGDQVSISNEGYELKFLGKNYARLLTSLETETVVVPDKEHNEKQENEKSKNVYISGDNLDALKHLLKSKQGQVKCIYIDPPYNTGSDGFVYNDSFGFKVEELASKLSISENEAWRILDFTKRGSASHSAWMMFMYPRLMLARDLLAKDGVIFISIDDNEVDNLKLLCDDIFGEDRFIAKITTLCNPKGRSQDMYLATCHEYLLVYSRTKLEKGALSIDKDQSKIISEYPLEDEYGLYRELELRNTHRDFGKHNRPNLYYPIYVNEFGDVALESSAEFNTAVYPLWEDGFEGCWTWDKKKASNEIELLVGHEVKGRWTIFRKSYAMQDGEVVQRQLKSIWLGRKISTERGQEVVNSLFETDEKIFQGPKSPWLVEKILAMSHVGDGDVVLDFFSGSATTADAVLRANEKETEGKGPNYILVQLPESIPNDKPAYKFGYRTIDEIGQARIKKAAAKIAEENPLLAKTMDLGFKHYTLKEVEGKTLDKIEKFDLNDNALAATDDILKEFGVETVLATWLVHDGYGFSAEPKVVELDGYKAYWMEKHVYLIEPGLSDKGISALFDKFETDGTFNPGNVVVFGYSFSWTQLEALKNNLLKIAANGTNKHVLLDKRY